MPSFSHYYLVFIDLVPKIERIRIDFRFIYGCAIVVVVGGGIIHSTLLFGRFAWNTLRFYSKPAYLMSFVWEHAVYITHCWKFKANEFIDTQKTGAGMSRATVKHPHLNLFQCFFRVVSSAATVSCSAEMSKLLLDLWSWYVFKKKKIAFCKTWAKKPHFHMLCLTKTSARAHAHRRIHKKQRPSTTIKQQKQTPNKTHEAVFI